MINEFLKSQIEIMQEKIALKISSSRWSREMAVRVIRKRRSKQLRRRLAYTASAGLITVVIAGFAWRMNPSQEATSRSLSANAPAHGKYAKMLAYSPDKKSWGEAVINLAITEDVNILIKESLQER